MQRTAGSGLIRRTVSALLDDLRHGGALDGATRIGQASADGRLVRIGLYVEGGRVVRARWKASTCASLMAYAECACAAIDAGVSPEAVTAEFLVAHVAGVHPWHTVRADLVARALAAALHPDPVPSWEASP